MGGGKRDCSLHQRMVRMVGSHEKLCEDSEATGPAGILQVSALQISHSVVQCVGKYCGVPLYRSGLENGSCPQHCTSPETPVVLTLESLAHIHKLKLRRHSSSSHCSPIEGPQSSWHSSLPSASCHATIITPPAAPPRASGIHPAILWSGKKRRDVGI